MPRRDDDLFDTFSIVPDTDSRAIHPDNPARPTPPRRSSNSTAPSPTGGVIRQILLSIVLIALATACGYFHYQQTRQLELNAKLQKRLESLESQLGLTTAAGTPPAEPLGDRVKDLDERMKSADGEIRKLWGVTNDKNRKALESHDSKIAELDKTLASVQASLTEMKKSVAQTEKTATEANRAAAESNQAVADTARGLTEMRSSVGTLQQRIAQGDPLVREASQQAAMAQEQNEQLQSRMEGLARKVSEHDESIRSIDTFRRSVSNDLGKLKQQSIDQGAQRPY